MTNRTEPKSIAEAKAGFAAAMDRLSPTDIVKSHPLRSAAAAAAAGALLGGAGRRLLALVFPITELVSLYCRLKNGGEK